MSIYNTKLSDIKQRFDVTKEDKLYYGEIYTPFSLIDAMLHLFDTNVFEDPTKKWLDIGAGLGYFSILLFYKLDKGLSEKIPNETERKTHIIEQMIYMIELKEENINELKKTFGEKANIIHGDFINQTVDIENKTIAIENHTFDYIIGNPPYNSKGIKKVPTNTTSSKKNEGQTVWTNFIIKSLSLLTPTVGKLCLIIPSLWLKKDKEGMHQVLTHYKIDKLHCLNSTQTNILFNGNAQTPTCYFLLTKKPTDGLIQLFDKKRKTYVVFPHTIGHSIPLFGAHIVTKLQKWITGLQGVGCLKVIKTNMPSVHSKFTEQLYDSNYPYTNIKTCLLEGLQPVLTMNYSNIPQPFYNIKKLILAHKMYGFPYFDSKGHYGISNRDNYVILNKTDEEFKQLKYFLSSKLALYLFEVARYRMKYLEKYAFEFIPDITQLPDFPSAATMNETTIADYFELDKEDRTHIQELHRKEYKMFN